MNYIKKLILKIIYILPLKYILLNNILIESNPDFSDNALYVYKELLKRKINNKYKIIWILNNNNSVISVLPYNVITMYRTNRLKFIFYNIFSKYIIDCNNYIIKRNKSQFRIHLSHGTPLKVVKNYCEAIGAFDVYICLSDYFKKIIPSLYKNYDENKIIPIRSSKSRCFF